MAGELLLDAGALVSLLDASQALHVPVRECFEAWEASVVSTEAVLTEATHLLSRVQGERQACLDIFLSGGAIFVPATIAALARSRELLDKYADLPMDYADSTLVVLAEELGTELTLTTDRRDFAVYRVNGRRRFEILPK